MRAADALQAAAVAALAPIEGLAMFDGAPVQAAVPYALVEAGAESDWGHKSGAGREVRLTVAIRDKGERPVRLRRLMDEAEAAVAGIGPEIEGWRVVSLAFRRSWTVPPRGSGDEWAGVVEFRARVLAT